MLQRGMCLTFKDNQHSFGANVSKTSEGWGKHAQDDHSFLLRQDLNLHFCLDLFPALS